MLASQILVHFFRKNVLKVHVFYEELNVELITEERSYEVSITLTFLKHVAIFSHTETVERLTSLLQTRESQTRQHDGKANKLPQSVQVLSFAAGVINT